MNVYFEVMELPFFLIDTNRYSSSCKSAKSEKMAKNTWFNVIFCFCGLASVWRNYCGWKSGRIPRSIKPMPCLRMRIMACIA